MHCKRGDPTHTEFTITVQSTGVVDMDVIKRLIEQQFEVVKITKGARTYKEPELTLEEFRERVKIDLDAEEVCEEAVQARRDSPSYSENIKKLGYDDESIVDRLPEEKEEN